MILIKLNINTRQKSQFVIYGTSGTQFLPTIKFLDPKRKNIIGLAATNKDDLWKTTNATKELKAAEGLANISIDNPYLK